MPRVEFGDSVFRGFEPLPSTFVSRFVQPTPENLVSKWRERQVQVANWLNFQDGIQIALGRDAIRFGIPRWRWEAFENVYQLASEVANLIATTVEAVSEVVSLINQAVSTYLNALGELCSSIPILGWVIDLGKALYSLIDVAIKLAKTVQSSKKRLPKQAALGFRREEDEIETRAALDAHSQNDWMAIFSPKIVDGQWGTSEITWTIGGSTAQGLQFRPTGGFIADHFGCLPGLGEQLFRYEYPFESDWPYWVSRTTTPLTTEGSAHPSMRQLSTYLWQALMKPGVPMFQIQPDTLADRWEGYFSSLSEAWKDRGSRPKKYEHRDNQLEIQTAAALSAAYSRYVESDKYMEFFLQPSKGKYVGRFGLDPRDFGSYDEGFDGRWPKPGEPVPYPLAPIVKNIIGRLKERMEATLKTLWVAYIPPDSPALNESQNGLRALYNEMRTELLAHPALCDVELDLIPDQAYRAQVQDAIAARPGKCLAATDAIALAGLRPFEGSPAIVPTDAPPAPPTGEPGGYGGYGGYKQPPHKRTIRREVPWATIGLLTAYVYRDQIKKVIEKLRRR